MVKRLVIVVVLLALLTGGPFFLLNSSNITEKLLTSAINKNLKGSTLEQLKIGRQKFTGDRLVFSDVRIKIKSKELFYTVVVQEIECFDFIGLLDPAHPLSVRVKQAALDSVPMVLKPGEIDARVYFKRMKLDRFEGKALVPYAEVYKYRLDHLTVHFNGDLKRLALHDLRADSYQGKLSGDILLDWQKNLPYSVNVHFEGLDLRPMKEFNPSIGEVEGIVSGSLTVQGNTLNFNALDFKAKVTKDGKVNASLLKFVTPYIPRTQESVALDGMMARGEKIPVEIAALEIRSIDEHKLSGFVKLFVGKLNLDLNLPVDILYDGNLISLIEWYRKLKS